jgi:hypothetical protein
MIKDYTLAGVGRATGILALVSGRPGDACGGDQEQDAVGPML